MLNSHIAFSEWVNDGRSKFYVLGRISVSFVSGRLTNIAAKRLKLASNNTKYLVAPIEVSCVKYLRNRSKWFPPHVLCVTLVIPESFYYS